MPDQNNWTMMEEEEEEKKRPRPSSGIGYRIRNAASTLKKKLTPKRKRNFVKEISIKPEKEQNECWTEAVTRISSEETSDEQSQRSLSANSSKGGAKGQDIQIDDLDEDDGIETIYDAEYNGGGV